MSRGRTDSGRAPREWRRALGRASLVAFALCLLAAVPPAARVLANDPPLGSRTPDAADIDPAVSPPANVSPRCSSEPIRGFGKVYDANPSVVASIGCPLSPERGIRTAVQPFEAGLLLWRADNREIIVLRVDGVVSTYQDTYQEGETLTPAGTPPSGRSVPIRGFGKAWRDHGLAEQLGWATARETGMAGAIQDFDGGQMLWIESRVIYVIHSDSRWESFEDTFIG